MKPNQGKDCLLDRCGEKKLPSKSGSNEDCRRSSGRMDCSRLANRAPNPKNQLPSKPKAQCSSDADCSSKLHYCDKGSCVAILKLNDKCASSAQCGSGSLCYNDRCKQTCVLGASSHACPSGATCVKYDSRNGVCEGSSYLLSPWLIAIVVVLILSIGIAIGIIVYKRRRRRLIEKETIVHVPSPKYPPPPIITSSPYSTYGTSAILPSYNAT